MLMVGDPVPDGPNIHCNAPKGLKFPGVTLCFFQTMVRAPVPAGGLFF